jgi:hypothetical protein
LTEDVVFLEVFEISWNRKLMMRGLDSKELVNYETQLLRQGKRGK